MENLYTGTGLGTIRRQRSSAPEMPHKRLKGKCILAVQQHYMAAMRPAGILQAILGLMVTAMSVPGLLNMT